MGGPSTEHLTSSGAAIAKEIVLVALVTFLFVRAFWLVPERDFLGPAGATFDRILRQAIAVLFAITLAVKWIRWWVGREHVTDSR